MFLIRSVFWVSLIVLMLPVGGNSSSNLVGATKYAFQDMGKFCDRNVDICNIGTEAWKNLKYKAAYSFHAVVDMAKDIKKTNGSEYTPVYNTQKSTWETGSVEKTNAKAVRVVASQNTLRATDLQPQWTMKTNKI